MGLIVWAAYFVETWARAIVLLYRDRGAYLVLPFLLVLSLTSLTESVVLVYNDMRWAIFVALAVKAAYRDRPPARAPIRRAPSPTVTTSAPPPSARSTSRSSASGRQPQGDGVWPTSWL